MPNTIPKPAQEAASGSNGQRACSRDFHGQRALDWSAIEMEIHCIALRAKAVEMIGRNCQDDVHGEKLGDVFEMLTSHIFGDIERLKELLGLGREARS
jgi:hypothetical protein